MITPLGASAVSLGDYHLQHEDSVSILNFHKRNLNQYKNKFGPNYIELMNWWTYRNSWNKEQLSSYRKRFYRLDQKTYLKASKLALNLSEEILDRSSYWNLPSVECEIIAAHLYIERNISFTFLPLIFDL